MSQKAFIKELINVNPELIQFYSSDQYKLSLKIIDKMMELSLNSKQMSNLLEISHDLYLRLESGDNEVDTGEYHRALNKLNKSRLL